jgi:co-chaperonin GroES (HSP10)|tara:strand:+ start:750 stop:1004 length:255 start_codon:yes stop_codon:yes gene_type:complete
MNAIGNYIILEEVLEKIVKTEGGLELGEKHREDIRYRKGIVISSGPDVIKKNDKILFDKVAGHDVEHNKQIYKVIMLRDVIAVL